VDLCKVSRFMSRGKIPVRGGRTNFGLWTGLSLKVTAFCEVRPCGLVHIDGRFGRTAWLYVSIALVPWRWNQHISPKHR
jgi:hypothetical protein